MFLGWFTATSLPFLSRFLMRLSWLAAGGRPPPSTTRGPGDVNSTRRRQGHEEWCEPARRRGQGQVVGIASTTTASRTLRQRRLTAISASSPKRKRSTARFDGQVRRSTAANSCYHARRCCDQVFLSLTVSTPISGRAGLSRSVHVGSSSLLPRPKSRSSSPWKPTHWIVSSWRRGLLSVWSPMALGHVWPPSCSESGGVSTTDARCRARIYGPCPWRSRHSTCSPTASSGICRTSSIESTP